MVQPHTLFPAFAAGMALGVFFSINLWISVGKMTDHNTPWYVLLGGYVFRMSVVLLGFFLVMAGRWERMAAALLGFVIVREIMVHRLGRKQGPSRRIPWRFSGSTR